MAISVDSDQTAPRRAVCFGPRCLFCTQFVSNVRQLFAADDISRLHFQMHFFLALSGLIINFQTRYTECVPSL